MREIEFKEPHFKEVLRLVKICEESKSTSRPQQIHFNEITQKFEYYSPEEFDSIPDDIVFEHPENVIERYYVQQENIANAVTQADHYAGPELDAEDDMESEFLDEEETMQQGFSEEQLRELDQEIPPIFENDDPEVLQATTHNLKIIGDIRSKLQTEQREELSKIIADIYKCDTISESDVALSLVENNEYKKLLSMLFGTLDVTVSSTKVSQDLKVSSGSLTFNPKIEYGLEDYRRGAAQCLADVRHLRESRDQIKTLEETIRELTSNLASVRKELNTSNDKYIELQNQRNLKKEQGLLKPATFIIAWKSGSKDRFLRVVENAKLGEDGTYPTKYLTKTRDMDKAQTFSEEQARKQIERLVKYCANLSFVNLKEAGKKEASDFFSIYKTTIEKA
jgi:hypothetical protein